MRYRLAGCRDCGHRLSPTAFACPRCGKPLRPTLHNEGPFLRTLNALTIATLWFLGIPIAFAALISLLQGAATLFNGIRATL